MEHCELMPMFLDPVQILLGPEDSLSEGCVLIQDKKIQGFGEEARDLAKRLGVKPTNSKNKVFAPCLVDPHSVLEDPFNSSCQTITSLRKEAAMAGYGQIAILPKCASCSDRSDRLPTLSNQKEGVLIHLWGSFSIQGEGKELAHHNELINFGAIGLAEYDSIPPTELLKKGFILGEMGKAPILLAVIDSISFKCKKSLLIAGLYRSMCPT